MNSNIPTEEKLETLINIYKLASLSRPIENLQSDAKDLFEAQMLLESRKDEIAELNKLCDKLDTENGKLKEHIVQHEADTREWQITIRELQDQMDKMRRETVHLDRVREVLGMAEFTLNVVSRSYGMPIDAVAMFDNLVAQLRSELIYTPDDEIPF